MRIVRAALWAGLFLLVCLSAVVAVNVARLPDIVRIVPGQEHEISVRIPLTLDWSDVPTGMTATRLDYGLAVRSREEGEGRFEYRLFGLLPVKQLVVDVVPEVSVVPGGQALGVLVSSDGLTVSRTVEVVDARGRRRSPAEEAGIQSGDMLTAVEGTRLQSVQQLVQIVQRQGRADGAVRLDVLRGEERVRLTVHPAAVGVEGIDGGRALEYRIGVVLEDPATGVGTLTFYEPSTGQYGALGHVITTAGHRQAAVNDGRVVRAEISAVERGHRGRPGQKMGIFQAERGVWGSVERNTPYGIFGHLFEPPGERFIAGSVPVAMASEIEPGPAHILTVLRGDLVEQFDVEILRIDPDRRGDGKGLVVKVIDPELLQVAGGIVQGMSGSPILQGGKLVGAVTHVFVNDPTRGFGVPAEWMLEQLDQWPSVQQTRSAEHAPGGSVPRNEEWQKEELKPKTRNKHAA